MFSKLYHRIRACFRLRNQKGVALLFVIAFIWIVSTVVFDVLEKTVVNTAISTNAEARIKAYYLARSSTNLSKLSLYLIYYKYKSLFENFGFDPNTALANFAIDTTKLRGFLGATGAGGGEAPAEDGEESADAASDADGGFQISSSLGTDTLQDFLAFEGEFIGTFSQEQSKLSINAFAKMDPAAESYDLYKKLLLEILLGDSFTTFFEDQEQGAGDLTHAIADYVDTNTSVNEFNKYEGGHENSQYEDGSFQVKNAKYLTLSELRLVAGMSDDIYQKLEPYVTIYHTNTKVNVCGVTDAEVKNALMDALIVYYTKYGDCTTPLDPKNDKDTIATYRDELLMLCGSTSWASSIASALNIRLGLKEVEDVTASDKSGTSETKATSSKVAECKVQFEDIVGDANPIFKIESSGIIDNVQRKITVVLDVSSSTPVNWKTLFYQVE